MEFFQEATQSIDVGSRLRQLRQERDMSMRALARLSGLSTNALSMIERGRTSPSVSTLYKIADALAVPITAFFRTEPPKKDIVYRKASQRTQLPVPRGVWEGLGGEEFTGHMEPMLISLDPGANSGQFPMLHSGHEFVICLSGELEYEVEKQRFILEAGDSLIFAAQFEHRWRNRSHGPTKALIVLGGFNQGESPSEFHLFTAPDEEAE